MNVVYLRVRTGTPQSLWLSSSISNHLVKKNLSCQLAGNQQLKIYTSVFVKRVAQQFFSRKLHQNAIICCCFYLQKMTLLTLFTIEYYPGPFQICTIHFFQNIFVGKLQQPCQKVLFDLTAPQKGIALAICSSASQGEIRLHSPLFSLI